MKADFWQEVEKLFHSVLELDPSQWNEYLDKACAGDESLRKEVESLIASDEQAGRESFLKEPGHLNISIDKDINQSHKTRSSATSQNEDNSMPSDDEMPSLDFLLDPDRFTILKRLGVGGFGAVYQAFDQQQKSLVALKLLHQADATGLYDFKKEFRSLADIIHPNLINLYELIAGPEQCLFTMELVDGVNFYDYATASTPTDSPSPVSINGTIKVLPNAPPPNFTKTNRPSALTSHYFNENYLRAALRQVVKGLLALHKAGKLHRDIKPSNVLVTNDGRVVILDFGLVDELDPGSGELATNGGLTGTPAYMSPEQCARKPLTPASDWYSVGVMLFETLTGKLPFNGSLIEVIYDKLHEEPVPPIKLNPNIPADLNEICFSLLSQKPEDRLNGEELLSKLGSAQTTARLTDMLNLANLAAQPSNLFLGRERELAELQNCFLQAREGSATIVYVHGSSGMGKSMLARQFLDQLQSKHKDLVVLMGRCYKQESVPYKAFDSIIDALTKYIKDLPKDAAMALMPRDAQALARLFPVLSQVNADTEALANSVGIRHSQELRRQAFAALRELLSKITEQKQLILFIDDLQWGDVDSVALIKELFCPPKPPALLFLATYRSEEADTSPMLRLLLSPDEMAQMSQNTHEIIVNKLTLKQAQKLAASLVNIYHSAMRDTVAIDALCQEIARETDCQPYFIDCMARYLPRFKSSDPEVVENQRKVITLSEIIMRQVRQLPESARQLLEIVVVAGHPIKLLVAENAADKLHPQDWTAFTILGKSHLVRLRETATGDEVEPYHDQIREAVIASLTAAELKAYHHALALELEADNSDDPERLMIHFQGAEDYVKAAHYAVVAAEQAFKTLAFDHTAQLYQSALDFLPADDVARHHLQVKLADALSKAGRGAKAAQIYLACAKTAQSEETLELQRRAAEQLLISGHIDDGIEVLRIVLDKVGLQLAKTPNQALVSLLQRRFQIWLRGLEFSEQDISQIPQKELARIDICWSVSMGLSTIDTIYGADFQALHLLLALRMGEPNRVARALAYELAYRALSGTKGHNRRLKLTNTTRILVKRLNNPTLTGTAKLMEGIAAWAEGQWQPARQLCQEAENILQDNLDGAVWERNTAHLFGLHAILQLGQLNHLSNIVPIMLKEAQERGDLYAEINLRLRSATYFLCLAADDAEKAAQEVALSVEKWAYQGFHIQHYFALVARVEIAIYRQQGASAWQLFNSQWAQLKQSQILRLQTLRIEAIFLRARSLVTAAMADANAKPLLKAAERDIKLIESEKIAWGRPLASLIRAAINSIQGNFTAAITNLIEAEVGFESVDMILYAAAARRCRGQLTGGKEGKELMEMADACLINQNIKNIEKMTQLLAPGQWQR